MRVVSGAAPVPSAPARRSTLRPRARRRRRAPRPRCCLWWSPRRALRRARSCAEVLGYLVAAMAKDALSAHCLVVDATGVLVQAKDKCRRGHFWVLVADRDHVLFRFTPRHNQDGPKEFLRGYKGYVQADASSVHEELFRTEQVTEAGCWAHFRRRFFETMSSDRERATTELGFIHQLFAIDEATEDLAPGRRTEQRRSHAMPSPCSMPSAHGSTARSSLVLPRSPVAGAIGDARNQWPALIRFLEDGWLRLDRELDLLGGEGARFEARVTGTSSASPSYCEIGATLALGMQCFLWFHTSM
jgi:hypothetical protein